jgi:hypothetical protein
MKFSRKKIMFSIFLMFIFLRFTINQSLSGNLFREVDSLKILSYKNKFLIFFRCYDEIKDHMHRRCWVKVDEKLITTYGVISDPTRQTLYNLDSAILTNGNIANVYASQIDSYKFTLFGILNENMNFIFDKRVIIYTNEQGLLPIPKVLAMKNDRFIITAESNKNGNYYIYTKLYLNDGTFIKDFESNNYLSTKNMNPNVCQLQTKQFVITFDLFNTNNDNKYSVFFDIFDENGVLLHKRRAFFEENKLRDHKDNKVACLSSNRIAISYSNDIYIFVSVFTYDGLIINSDINVDENVSYPKVHQIYPINNRRFIVAYETETRGEGPQKDYMIQIFNDSGFKIGKNIKVSQKPTRINAHNNLNTISFGKVFSDIHIGVWYFQDPYTYGMNEHGYLSFKKLDFEGLINESTIYDQLNPSISYLEKGDYVFAWESIIDNSGNKKIFAKVQNFNQNLIKLSEFIVEGDDDKTLNKYSPKTLSSNFDQSIISYYVNNNNNYFIKFSKYDSKGTLIINKKISDTGRISSYDIHDLNNGTILIIWECYYQPLFNNGNREIFITIVKNNDNFDIIKEPFLVKTNKLNYQRKNPKFVIMDDANKIQRYVVLYETDKINAISFNEDFTIFKEHLTYLVDKDKKDEDYYDFVFKENYHATTFRNLLFIIYRKTDENLNYCIYLNIYNFNGEIYKEKILIHKSKHIQYFNDFKFKNNYLYLSYNDKNDENGLLKFEYSNYSIAYDSYVKRKYINYGNNSKISISHEGQVVNIYVSYDTDGSGYSILYNIYDLCPQGHFPDSLTKICKGCEINCITCIETTNCCKFDHYPFSDDPNNCVLQPNGYFLNSNKWEKCNISCKSCIGSGSHCSECADNYYKLEDKSNTCGDSSDPNNSPDGYYFQSTPEKIFKLCDKSCSTCIENAKNCKKCSNNYYYIEGNLDNSCTNTPPENHYLDKKLNLYRKCDIQCIDCENESNYCTKCNLEKLYFPLENNKNNCFHNCPDYYYKNYLSKMCIFCHKSCKKCKDDTANCEKCAEGFFPLSDKPSNCLQNSPDETYKFDEKNQQFFKCPFPGLVCDENKKYIKCNDGYFLHIDKDTVNSECIKKCPKGFWGNEKTKKCERCISPCEDCENESKCLECVNDFYLTEIDRDSIANKNCVKNCPEKFYGDKIKKRCEKCQESCITCDSYDKCNSCKIGFFFNKETKNCLNKCPDSYYENKELQECWKCSNNCLKCESETKCLQCISSNLSFLNLLTNSCEQKCPDNYYGDLNENKCKKCHETCNTCKGDKISDCLSCHNKENQNLKLIEGICSLDCPDEFVKEINTQYCFDMKKCFDNLLIDFPKIFTKGENKNFQAKFTFNLKDTCEKYKDDLDFKWLENSNAIINKENNIFEIPFEKLEMGELKFGLEIFYNEKRFDLIEAKTFIMVNEVNKIIIL